MSIGAWFEDTAGFWLLGIWFAGLTVSAFTGALLWVLAATAVCGLLLALMD